MPLETKPRQGMLAEARLRLHETSTKIFDIEELALPEGSGTQGLISASTTAVIGGGDPPPDRIEALLASERPRWQLSCCLKGA
jgi:hypothetical protein